jgi:hypothetical protein
LPIDTILSELKAERDRLNRAIAALEGIDREPSSTAVRAKGRKKGRPKMSAEARQRLSEAKKEWWAKRKRKKTA